MERGPNYMTQGSLSGRVDASRMSSNFSYQNTIDENKMLQSASAYEDISLPNLSIHENNMLASEVSIENQSISNEYSIEHLYPAWVTLVNLMDNDAFARFKLGPNGKAKWRESDLDQIPAKKKHMYFSGNI